MPEEQNIEEHQKEENTNNPGTWGIVETTVIVIVVIVLAIIGLFGVN